MRVSARRVSASARHRLKRLPGVRRVLRAAEVRRFPGSATYWEARYAQGRNSGSGSYGEVAEFKASVLNRLVAENQIGSVLELGCGDGHQLSLAEYPSYVGVDVSPTALAMCRERFKDDPSKRFTASATGPADLAMALDVILHLVEDDVFDDYMTTLFASATRMVVVFDADIGDKRLGPHIRYRDWRSWVTSGAPGWQLSEQIANRLLRVRSSRAGD